MNIFRQHSANTKVAVINCSGQTSSVHVIQKLTQMCTLQSTNTGRVLRPKDCSRAAHHTGQSALLKHRTR